MEYLNLMRNKLKPKEVNDALENVNTTNASGSTTSPTAETTSYDNTSSGLTATNVQSAIDEVVDELETKTATIVPKVSIIRNGKNRLLILDSVTLIDTVIATLSVGDRPTMSFGALGRWLSADGYYYPCFISVLDNGNIMASNILPDGTAHGILNGTIIGSISYIV